jgi:hypothetical protein
MQREVVCFSSSSMSLGKMAAMPASVKSHLIVARHASEEAQQDAHSAHDKSENHTNCKSGKSGASEAQSEHYPANNSCQPASENCD